MPTKKELEEYIKQLENQLSIEKEKNILKCPYCGCKSVRVKDTYKEFLTQYYIRECFQCCRTFTTDLNNKLILS
jgi:late competence protein required for DNA uptake (superfamily II DNA/RNA helicase)